MEIDMKTLSENQVALIAGGYGEEDAYKAGQVVGRAWAAWAEIAPLSGVGLAYYLLIK
jgi:hypothetical protein